MMSDDQSGVLVILAYPAEFVSMIPAWYRKPMEWIGMVNNGKVCVGHSAMALIDKTDGKIHYADFGRYITPFGYGRTRMAKTDPDVAFDYVVEFNDQGKVKDPIALFQHFYDHPEKTHGGDVMYVSLNHNCNFRHAFDFMQSMNNKGSIIYDPFGKGRSNCSRFVFDAILHGLSNKSEQRKLKRKSPLTPSPLANVFHGTAESSYRFSPEGHHVVRDKSLKRIVKYFFKKPPSYPHSRDNGFAAQDHMHFLDGIGDQAYFYTEEVKDNLLRVTKLDKDGHFAYTKEYHLSSEFDPSQPYKFIHDCNASWVTVEQDSRKIKMDAV